MADMNSTPLVIGGIEFIEPVLENVVIDHWNARIELVVGETEPPHSWKRPHVTRFTFTGVIEVRAHRGTPPTKRDEISEAGEVDAGNEVERTQAGNIRLLNTAFRNPAKVGFTWAASAPNAPRLVWVASDASYIEFVYAGEVSHEQVE